MTGAAARPDLPHGDVARYHAAAVELADEARRIAAPLDPGSDRGTDELVHGVPTWGSMIALHRRGAAVVGLIDHPPVDLRVSAGIGLGAHRNGQRIACPTSRPGRGRRRSA